MATKMAAGTYNFVTNSARRLILVSRHMFFGVKLFNAAIGFIVKQVRCWEIQDGCQYGPETQVALYLDNEFTDNVDIGVKT